MFYTLINYFDVWGNPKDGWEVNNQCVEFDDLYLSDDITDKEIVTYLRDTGYLKTNDLRKLTVDRSSFADVIEILAKNGCPLFALRANDTFGYGGENA